MSISTHHMPGGGIATVLHRKISTEKALLLHFGFRSNSFMICGFCGAGCVLKQDQNFEDAAKWFHKHCINHRQGRASIPHHPTEETIPEKTIAAVIAPTSNANNVRAFVGSCRSRLISKQFLKTVLGGTVVESMGYKSDVEISHCCLKVGKCCMKRQFMMVGMYRAGVKMDPLYCTDDLVLLQREYAMLEPSPSPPPPSPSTLISLSSVAQPSTNSVQYAAAMNLLVRSVARSRANTIASASTSQKKLRLMVAPAGRHRVNFAVDEI